MVREVDESMVEENERSERNEDPEYVRTVVVCDSTDEFLQKVIF